MNGKGREKRYSILLCWHGASASAGEGFKSNLDSFQWTLTHGNYKVEPQIIRPDWLSFFFTYYITTITRYIFCTKILIVKVALMCLFTSEISGKICKFYFLVKTGTIVSTHVIFLHKCMKNQEFFNIT